MFAHLHVRSWFSFLSGGSSPLALVQRARELGIQSLALTDRNGLYGIVRFQKACCYYGLRAITGAEVVVNDHPLVLLVRSERGYRDLCRLLTDAHLGAKGLTVQDLLFAGDPPTDADKIVPLPTDQREGPKVDIEQLAGRCSDLICLTGGRDGQLWQLTARRAYKPAQQWLRTLRELFPTRDQLYVELVHGLLPEDGGALRRLYELAEREQVPVVASNDVRYAEPAHWKRYDLLTCIRLIQPVAEPHAERPRNAEAYLKSEQQLRRLIPIDAAFDNSLRIADSCRLNIVPEYITPPAAKVPEKHSANSYLIQLCDASIERLYPKPERPRATRQMHEELEVISNLKLEEFFLVVHEVVDEARKRGIRCAGRGSAANSIIAYLLGITAVDPIHHNLLFARFLHGGRKGTPDIDVDFDADRRDEIIEWMEQRFGIEQTAMTATLITYKLRLALRDVAKALGWPMLKVDELSQSIPSDHASEVLEHREPIVRVLGESPLTELLFKRVADLADCPRHLGLHVGGMVLCRKALSNFSPVQVSANGVKMVQFDKDDIEAMGLVKLDVLGLRMMACLSESIEIVKRHEGIDVDLDSLPIDDEGVFDLIQSSKTMTLFQIESQGQMHLIAKNQPQCFDDLVSEVALFRPGPLQGGMVHPFIRRRRGWEKVSYDHPSLEPILADTYGVILYQEQILEIAHRFAGMPLDVADNFRQLTSKRHDPEKLELMGQQFITGAIERGASREVAETVFEKVSHFIGYGFCRSHAAAFAKTVYHSAWMKCYHPAAHMAAFMQHRPGFYNLMTLEEESRRCGVPVRLPDINDSGIRYDLVRTNDGQLVIQKPLTTIKGITEEKAQQIAWARMAGHFTSVENFASRVHLDRDALDVIARSGALDRLAGSSRRALWEGRVIANRLNEVDHKPPTNSLFKLPLLIEEDVPELKPLTDAERISWDYQTTSTGRVHPIILARRHLNNLGIQTVESCYRYTPLEAAAQPDKGETYYDNHNGPVVNIAGIVIVRQRPPTAKGFMFITLEDETGFLQCVLNPKLQEYCYQTLIKPAIIVRGQLQATGKWRGIVVSDAWPLEGVFGGYSGFPSARGDQDHLDDGERAIATGVVIESDGRIVKQHQPAVAGGDHQRQTS
ncbi:MAG: DNA polymerase III subunit alpha [Candidatus Latescibacterota bacterium]|nr:DNA polymerase III subunit alpha [Candidatus Latescibacterota bacterium]